MPKIDAFFKFMVENGSSDLHMAVGAPPMIRQSGEMRPIKFKELTSEGNKIMFYEILNDVQRETFEKRGDLDFAYEIEGLARFRGNLFMQRKGPSAVFRIIPSTVLSAQQLNLPESVLRFAKLHKGMVLVTGPTGSGKSTTLAAIIDHINETRRDHILTVEDPIEFVHKNKRCLVNQREVKVHTESFASALKGALRQDPDIILVGEMRDLETIELACTAAETGHLVFGTLHTISAPKTVDRLINVFPMGQQDQIRMMLSESVKGVVSQTLCKKKGGGRVAALEIMYVTSAIANLIREGKTFQLKSSIQTGRSQGMQTIDQALMDLLQSEQIEIEEAMNHAQEKKLFEGYLAQKPKERPTLRTMPGSQDAGTIKKPEVEQVTKRPGT
ncbi:MAG: type IV pilus twitching motility protein PilT [Pseudomonadota bacterium]